MNRKALILVAEDSDEDFDMLQLAFERSGVKNRVLRFSRGDDILDFLFSRGGYAAQTSPLPNLILLDLNLIGTDGRQVLQELKSSPHLRAIPVVVLTTSSNPKDVGFCYTNGVNAYLLKPVDLERFERMIEIFTEFWLDAVVLPDVCSESQF